MCTQMKVHKYSMPCGLHECLDQSELCFFVPIKTKTIYITNESLNQLISLSTLCRTKSNW